MFSHQIRDCCTGASRTFHSGLHVGRDQIVDNHSGESVADGLVALANASDVVAPNRTDNTGGGKHRVKGGSTEYVRTHEQYNLRAEVRRQRENQQSQRHQ